MSADASFGAADDMPEVMRICSHPPIDFVRINHPFACAWALISDGGLRVIISESEERDGKRWLHVSCSRATRIPTWQDIRRVKDAFVGKDRKAIQVLPAAAEYVNINPNVLHLWCCLDGDPLPDFRRGGAI